MGWPLLSVINGRLGPSRRHTRRAQIRMGDWCDPSPSGAATLAVPRARLAHDLADGAVTDDDLAGEPDSPQRPWRAMSAPSRSSSRTPAPDSEHTAGGGTHVYPRPVRNWITSRTLRKVALEETSLDLCGDRHLGFPTAGILCLAATSSGAWSVLVPRPQRSQSFLRQQAVDGGVGGAEGGRAGTISCLTKLEGLRDRSPSDRGGGG